MQLLLGSAKVDITPDHPVPLAGFGVRTGVFDGVRHRIYARILLLRQPQERGMRHQLLVAADLLWWGNERMEELRGKLAARWGLRAEDILLGASHSHSGPQTSRLMPAIGRVDEQYLQTLEGKLFAGIEQAAANLEPVTVERGSGACDIGIHRRKRVDGKIVMAPNEEGPTDPEVTVVRFNTRAGRAKALLVHYTCHPTTTNANYVSSEYCGLAMERVERELGNGCVSLFLQGCCGDVRPSLYRDGKFFHGSDKDVQALAERFYEAIRSVLERPLQMLRPCLLDGARTECPLAFANVPTAEELARLSGADDPKVRHWARHLLEHPELLRPAVSLDMVRMDIAEGLSLLSMNAEMVVEYGLYVKRRSGGSALPVAYANGMIGYVSTAAQLAEGGYEATDSYYYFGLCSPFTKAAEPSIRESIDGLLHTRQLDGIIGKADME